MSFPDRGWRLIRMERNILEVCEGQIVVHQAARKCSACQLLEVEGSQWV